TQTHTSHPSPRPQRAAESLTAPHAGSCYSHCPHTPTHTHRVCLTSLGWASKATEERCITRTPLQDFAEDSVLRPPLNIHLFLSFGLVSPPTLSLGPIIYSL